MQPAYGQRTRNAKEAHLHGVCNQQEGATGQLDSDRITVLGESK